jgi:hypothetical protein
VRSLEPEAMYLPSLEIAMEWTALLCLVSGLLAAMLVCASHVRIVQSLDPEITCFLSAEKTTDKIESVCPANGAGRQQTLSQSPIIVCAQNWCSPGPNSFKTFNTTLRIIASCFPVSITDSIKSAANFLLSSHVGRQATSALSSSSIDLHL